MIRKPLFTAGMAALATVGIGAGTVAAGPAASAAPAAASNGTTTPPDDTSGCADGHLPAALEGAPASYHAGAARGAWIWHTAKGYAIRVTHPQGSGVVEFTGSVTSDRPITVSGVQLEAGDRYWLSSDRRTLYFAFSNAGHTDGLDFVASCASTVNFGIRADGALLAPARIRLGAQAIAPASDPFTVRRRS